MRTFSLCSKGGYFPDDQSVCGAGVGKLLNDAKRTQINSEKKMNQKIENAIPGGKYEAGGDDGSGQRKGGSY